MGFRLEYEMTSQNRTGDHICYASEIEVRRTSRTTQAMGWKRKGAEHHEGTPRLEISCQTSPISIRNLTFTR